jgi:hypothetical protein
MPFLGNQMNKRMEDRSPFENLFFYHQRKISRSKATPEY